MPLGTDAHIINPPDPLSTYVQKINPLLLLTGQRRLLSEEDTGSVQIYAISSRVCVSKISYSPYLKLCEAKTAGQMLPCSEMRALAGDLFPFLYDSGA